MGDSKIGICELGAPAGKFAIFRNQAKQPVGIGRTGAGHNRGLSLHYRAFQMDPACQKPDPCGATPSLGVTLLGLDIEHRRHPASILYWNGTLVKLHIIHHVRVERREYPEHVGRIIDRVLVEQDKVLVRRAPADIETA